MRAPQLIVRIVALAAIYALIARFGLKMDAVSGFATLVWPPTGIALAALLVIGPRAWPGVAIGALIANVWAGAPLPVACGIAVGNTLEAALGAHLLRRIPGFDDRLGRLSDAVGVCTLGAMVSTAVSASVGVASLYAGGLVAPGRFAPTWRAWWVGDMLGGLVVAPLLLTWRPRAPTVVPSTGDRVGRLETLVLVTLLLAMGVFVFGPWRHLEVTAPFQQAYALFPPLIWAALRLGQRGATAATFAASVLAVWGTTNRWGPFVRGELNESLLYLQTFMAVAAVTALILGSVTTERRRAAEGLRAAHAELEDAVRVRDDFLSIASHELRTPLTALQLQTTALLRAARRGTLEVGPSILPKLEMLERQVGRLMKLIDELLDVSRITSGRLQLEREDLDLAALAREVLERLGDDLVRAGCAAALEAGAPARGAWDRGRIDQVVTNLLGNALKYGQGKPVRVVVGGDERTATIAVEDHGIGIAPEDQERIFERFERSASASQFGGFGLGLWIVAEIVRAHGGTIRVRSVLGEGATFTVELPRAPP